MICSRCKQDKDESSFFPSMERTCKECHRLYKLSGHARLRRKLRDAANKDAVREYNNQWRLKNRDHIRAYNAHYKYDLPVEKYKEMQAAQNNLCAVCSEPPPSGRPLCVDHCHKTGNVRALLCPRCNHYMHLVDDDDLHEKTIRYAEFHKPKEKVA